MIYSGKTAVPQKPITNTTRAVARKTSSLTPLTGGKKKSVTAQASVSAAMKRENFSVISYPLGER